MLICFCLVLSTNKAVTSLDSKGKLVEFKIKEENFHLHKTRQVLKIATGCRNITCTMSNLQINEANEST